MSRKKADEPADYCKRSTPPGPCPEEAAGRRCTYSLCDHFCGAPPPRIFGEVPAHG